MFLFLFKINYIFRILQYFKNIFKILQIYIDNLS